MELCSIASGSSGNCIYVGNKDTHLLVDTGISKKRIVEGLYNIDVDPEKLAGILITHEHVDHIGGLGPFLRKYHIPVYATRGTVDATLHSSGLGTVDRSLFNIIEPGSGFMIGDVEVKSFRISHDAAEPVCYVFDSEGSKVGVATDMGIFTEETVENLTGLSAVLLEANHDVHMLEAGIYPYMLKRRILGDKGHLSNDNSGRLLSRVWTEHLKHIFLGHLSKENNYPELAYETVRVELMKDHPGFETDTKLQVADRDKPTELISV